MEGAPLRRHATRHSVGVVVVASLIGCAGNPVEADAVPQTTNVEVPTSTGWTSVDDGASSTGDSSDAESGGPPAPDLPAPEDGSSTGTSDGAPACADGRQDPGEWCWTPPADIIVAGELFDFDVGDIDGDGAADFVIATDEGLLPVTRDAGVWTAGKTEVVTPQIRVVRCGRLDLDAIDDVVATDDAYGLWRSFGSATGLGAPSLQYVSENVGALALGDVDADGYVDAVLGSALYGSLAYLRGSADGTLTTLTTPQVGFAATSVALGDLDLDGRLDVVVTTLAPSLHVALFEPSTPAQPSVATYTSPAGRGTVVAADLDGDGALDVARLDHATGSLRLWHSEGGVLDDSVDLAVAVQAYDLAATDLDADGDIDLAVLGNDEVVPLENEGDVEFALRTAVPTPGAFVLRAADLDGDETPDVVVAGDGGLRLILAKP